MVHKNISVTLSQGVMVVVKNDILQGRVLHYTVHIVRVKDIR